MRLVLSTLFTTALSVASALSTRGGKDLRKRAVYALSNNAAGANLLALSISSKDGKLSKPVLTPTGGKGLLGKTMNGTAGPDGLFSQGAVTVSEKVSLPVPKYSDGKDELSMHSARFHANHG